MGHFLMFPWPREFIGGYPHTGVIWSSLIQQKEQEATGCVGYSRQKHIITEKQQEHAELVYVKCRRTECASQA